MVTDKEENKVKITKRQLRKIIKEEVQDKAKYERAVRFAKQVAEKEGEGKALSLTKARYGRKIADHVAAEWGFIPTPVSWR
mgnify:CR=1 FL=1